MLFNINLRNIVKGIGFGGALLSVVIIPIL